MPHRLKDIFSRMNLAPSEPGVYVFKDAQSTTLYIGKAKNIKTRLLQYKAGYGAEWKASSILDASDALEWHTTKTELDALLLEARLVQSYQPPFNVLLKTGQPYIYFRITSGKLPQFELARTKGAKGTYFGPFINKGAARSIFSFLQKTFQLFLCGRRVEGGCLAYHLGRCGGMCLSDFNQQEYEQRLGLVRKALTSKQGEMVAFLDERIKQYNAQLLFERSAQHVRYKEALLHVQASLASGFDRPTSIQRLAEKDVWIWREPVDGAPFGYLFLFKERHAVLKKDRAICVIQQEERAEEDLRNHIFEYYRLYKPAPQVLISHAITDSNLLAQFTASWHELSYSVTVNAPPRSEHGELMAHAQAYADAEHLKPEKMAKALQRFLKLDRLPWRIHCFDISHIQGRSMVGSSVRFMGGKPDIEASRHFHIKTLTEQNDYAALQEIVLRRYKTPEDFPDLIVIDGGKGQLSAIQAVLEPLLRGTTVGLVSLAKREETIFSTQFPEGKVLTGQLLCEGSLVALRDYAHHRAVSLHRKIKLRLRA